MKKKLLAILLTVCMVLSMAPAALAADSVFTDVNTGDWFAEEVKYVYDNGLMNGVGDNAFDPNGTVTRAMVWTTLARLDGVNTAGSDPWWLAGQKWAMENGISDGTMAAENITREQLVTMIWRYAKYIDMDVSEGEDTNILSYTDALDVNEWAISAMQWACGVGIINGIDGALQPQGDASRAMQAAILYRFVEEVMPGEEEPEPSTPVVPSYPSSPSIPPHSHSHSHSYTASYTSKYDGTHVAACACGATKTEDCTYEEGVCSKCGFVKGSVAKIGGVYYATLGEAVALAPEGSTVELLAEAELTDVILNVANTGGITIVIADGFSYNGAKAQYEIADLTGLKYFRDDVNGGNSYSGKTVALTADIDLGNEEWTPIGTSEKPFSGTFDGNVYSISNLTITSGDFVGLFGYVSDATIKNVVLVNAQVSGGERVGALVGKIVGDATVSDCSVDETSAVTGSDSNTGGLIGEIITGTVQCTNLVNNASVENTKNSNSRAGGIIGQVTTGADVTLTYCINNGDVKTNNGYAGGIVSAYQNGTLTINNCANTGALDGAYEGNMLGWYTSVRSITISTETNEFDLNAIGCVDIATSSNMSLYGKNYFVNKKTELTGVDNTKQKFSEIFVADKIGTSPMPLWDKLIAFYAHAAKTNSNFAGYAETYWEMFDISVIGYSEPDWNSYFDSYNAQCGEGNKLEKSDFTDASWREKIVYLAPQHDENEHVYKYTSNGDGTHNGLCACGVTVDDLACAYEEGVCSKCGFVKGSVAKIGGVYYASAQDALDAATDGDTIELFAGKHDDLVFRVTEDSELVDNAYYYMSNYDSSYYGKDNWQYAKRTINGLTITGVEGAIINSFTTSDARDDNGNAKGTRNNMFEITNLTISGITIANGISFNTSNVQVANSETNTTFVPHVKIDGLTIENCKTTTDGVTTQSGGRSLLGIANTGASSNAKNITVTGCTVTNMFQGVYVVDGENVRVEGNSFSGLTHNSIHINKYCSGTITISGNTIDNVTDRPIRFNGVQSGTVTISNNTITNSEGDNGEMIKASSMADGVSVTLSGNTWNGYTDEELGYANGVWHLPVVVSTAAAAQAALDAATPGTVIQLSEGVDYGTLYLRPVDGQANTITDCDYLVYRNEMLRKVENLTIVGAPDATVDAIEVVSGYIEDNTGYVVDIKNLVIDSVKFTDDYVNPNTAHSYSAPLFFDLSYINVDGLTVKNCELVGDNDNMNFVYFYGSGKVDNSSFDTAAKNITITGNTVDGIARLCELRQTENVTITGNTIKNTALHGMQLSVDGGTYSGNVTITYNIADGIGNRFVRMAGAGNAAVVITGNTITNYLGSDEDYIKVTDSTGTSTIENNPITDGTNGNRNFTVTVE